MVATKVKKKTKAKGRKTEEETKNKRATTWQVRAQLPKVKISISPPVSRLK
ncbi:hypothetical protein ACFLWX_02700 [Chloroflexota bacterium]